MDVDPSTKLTDELDPGSKPNDEMTTDHTMSVDEEFAARLKEVEECFKDAPARFRGYELLLDGPNDPYDKIPKGELYSTYVYAHSYIIYPCVQKYDKAFNWSPLSTLVLFRPPWVCACSQICLEASTYYH